jgi:hypothetical protein
MKRWPAGVDVTKLPPEMKVAGLWWCMWAGAEIEGAVVDGHVVGATHGAVVQPAEAAASDGEVDPR